MPLAWRRAFVCPEFGQCLEIRRVVSSACVVVVIRDSARRGYSRPTMRIHTRKDMALRVQSWFSSPITAANEPENAMTPKSPTQHGIEDARTFASEHPEDVAGALEPGQLGADESLISAMGAGATAKLFGVEPDSEAFSAACLAYNKAFDAELRRIAGSEVRATPSFNGEPATTETFEIGSVAQLREAISGYSLGNGWGLSVAVPRSLADRIGVYEMQGGGLGVGGEPLVEGSILEGL